MEMKHHTRRKFTLTAGATVLAGLSHAQVPGKNPVEPKIEDEIAWYNVRQWGVEGRGWAADQMENFYDRLPSKANGVVRDAVWNLSRDSAGLLTRFQTDASAIHVRYTLTSKRLSMPHMPATGVSGIDLYALDRTGQWRWVSVFKPGAENTGSPEINSGKLVDGLDSGRFTFMAYLPLYNGVKELEFGVPEGADFRPVMPRRQKPMVFYGTSITHGACASRPGMCHTAILGRRLDLPVINLGFSGNGRMELEVAALMAEIDASVYVIDCLPNITGDVVEKNTEPLVKLLRKVRPETPILLVEDRTYAYAWIKESARERHRQSRAALVRAYDKLVASGIRHLYYLRGEDLLGEDGEGTTDGSHPNDLGFMRHADAFEPVLRQALNS